MAQDSASDIETIVAKETWTVEDHAELLRQLFTMRDAPGKFRAIVAQMEAAEEEPRGAAAVKLGIAQYMLCRFRQALETLSAGTDNKDRRFFQAMCYRNLRRFDQAAEEFERAKDRGWDPVRIDSELVEIKALTGDVEAGLKALAKLERKIADTATYHYLSGLLAELSGQREEAGEAYVRARQIDPGHCRATFRLAYLHDLHGEEEEAIELYKECVSAPPVHANALLNLAVLYEDAGQNDLAVACLRRILVADPAHARARLFMKDAEASKTMFFDEDRARSLARRNALLDTPVTDFELSVRARNCLKKMDICTLGDLVRTTEVKLMAYKNFGETSLKEIRDMLDAKGLRLGQALEEGSELADMMSAEPVGIRNEGVLATPIEQIEFSIRIRRAITAMKVATLGELANKTEAELLACSNFGQTSLNEVCQRLAEYGLTLREPD